MKLWITTEPWGHASADTVAAAQAAGAEIRHGIPPALEDVIAAGTTGLVELPDPPPPPRTADERLADLLDALSTANSLAQVRAAARDAAT